MSFMHQAEAKRQRRPLRIALRGVIGVGAVTTVTGSIAAIALCALALELESNARRQVLIDLLTMYVSLAATFVFTLAVVRIQLGREADQRRSEEVQARVSLLRKIRAEVETLITRGQGLESFLYGESITLASFPCGAWHGSRRRLAELMERPEDIIMVSEFYDRVERLRTALVLRVEHKLDHPTSTQADVMVLEPCRRVVATGGLTLAAIDQLIGGKPELEDD